MLRFQIACFFLSWQLLNHSVSHSALLSLLIETTGSSWRACEWRQLSVLTFSPLWPPTRISNPRITQRSTSSSPSCVFHTSLTTQLHNSLFHTQIDTSSDLIFTLQWSPHKIITMWGTGSLSFGITKKILLEGDRIVYNVCFYPHFSL